ncbi:class Ib ribonucleoside-diphosphate reductase assembly flavoprotein NrdI [Vibrio coralliilyticus]|uniref:class Ib ribonucleoside-diphosphate reductase assembly flavoprotein NrdI n=1 Tax=Vibrio coralliilyticus TaxID=190893 RepID=UPI000BAB2185|nr:class Ib ribonucleoside-diphosphate reductase assembly flavoprotein NrdI [Vibrio coralliilyticus]NOI57983.1 class Ib ribonucleoside-diphosphate reductase assembly flavoprotein NrdI [Vibrio coralliilyticus]PAT69591.1 class Ib ribonucleoside-diphosphate reductase assembly flavoprotein NrdI [Vibrio coralliilyticus]
MIVYYSSASGNTQRFIEQLSLPAIRLPIDAEQALPEISQPFVLICPTYADGHGKGAVPKSVIKALNQPQNRALLKGVIASGNRNFGELFAHAGSVIANKCQVPVLYRFELSGTQSDVDAVRQGLEQFWKHHGQSIH